MHGNVWEWCEGSRREYKAEPVENPPDGQDRNSRALRGGSWFRVARLARSACRFGDHRDLRDRLCGFRFSLRSIKPSQGQVKDSGGAAVKGVLRPAEPGKGASGRGARDYEDRIFPDPFPPDCATAWGDDCFGLWFEFEVGGVTQRMRWIEPEKLFLHRDEIHVPALTINHGGYWIADTPCTTKLWVAVVGGDKYTNDTNLASDQLHVPMHPDEINNQFLTKLNQMIGKNFTAKLPTKSHLDFVCNKNTSEINSAKITDVGYKEKYFLRRLDASSCGLYNLYGSINEVTRDYSDGAKWRTSKSVRSAQATFEHDEHGFLVGQPMNLHPFRFIMDVHD
jgi:formylglycine-generating enzyme required for sulfatase activity